MPLVAVAGSFNATVDVPTMLLPQLMAALQTPAFCQALIREPQRSCISTESCQRLTLRIVFAADVTELEALLRLQSLRTLPFGDLVYYGLREVVGAADSLLLEFGTCLNFRRYWPLCRQVIFISPNKALIQTTTEAEQWCQVMNTVLERDADDATAKLRHKASVRGGRVVATPGATPAALAAARRGGDRKITVADCVATATVNGEVGHEDSAFFFSIHGTLGYCNGPGT